MLPFNTNPCMDVNNDFIINIMDIAELTSRYNERWNDVISRYDLNNDNITDIYDLVIMSKALN